MLAAFGLSGLFGQAPAALAASATTAKTAVNLTVDLRSNDAAVIRLEFPTQGQQQLELGLDDWGGLTDLAAGISALKAESAGRAISLETLGDGKWQLQAAGAERIALSYRIERNQRHRSGSNRDHYRAIVTPDLFHAVGHNALILPRHLPGPWQLELRWLLPEQWQAASSLTASADTRRVEVMPEELASSLLIAGKIRLLKRMVHEQPVYVAIHGDRWQFRDEAFADLVQRVLTTQREFFADYAFPHYLVSVLGVGEAIDNGYSLNGTRLHRNFALFMNPNATLAADSPVADAVESLLMHETFHEWNGGQLASDPAVKEGELYWFTEGFTNFYTRKLLQRSGLRNAAETLRSANELLHDYHFSPVRDQGNAVIAEQFWSSDAVQRLPYLRGDVLAVYLDLAIRQRSAGQHSLDDLMFSLLTASRQGRPLTADRFFAELANWLPAEERAQIRTFIEDGGELPALAKVLPPCLSLQPVAFYQWQAGFDIEASLADRVVKGVQPGSAAAKAGLRNGEQLLGWSLRWNDTTSPVELTLKDRAEPLRYLPRGAEAMAPQLVPAQTAGASSTNCSLLAD